MPILHMDTDACTDAYNQMKTTKQALEDQLNSITNRVNSMVGSEWIAPAADQFKGDFEEWRNRVVQTLTALEEMANGFNTEIGRVIDVNSTWRS